MRKKLLAILLTISLVMTFTTACGTSTTQGDPPPPPEQGKSINENSTVSFTDSAGRTVEIPADITRIASSGTLAQIVLFPLAADMLVGLASEWDPIAEKYIDSKYFNLPVLGQFYGKGDLNLEEVAKADPQLIIDIGESKSSIKEDMDDIMEQVGIPTVHIEATTDTMADAYRTLGKLLGKEKEGEVLAQYCEEIQQNTANIMEKVGESGKANIIYSVGEDGLNVLARGSFHTEILDKITNNLAVVDDISSKGTGNPVDMEQIILWDPDIIIFAPGGAYSQVSSDPTWQELKAIKNNQYYEVPCGPYNWMGNPPSVNRYIGMIWITQLLYPEVAQYDLFEETVRYYDLFYHSDLTKEQYEDLVKNSILDSK